MIFKYKFRNRLMFDNFRKPTNELLKIDTELTQIIQDYNLSDPVDHINFQKGVLEHEKAKFFEALKTGQEYNPQFSYKPISKKILSQIENRSMDVMKKLRSLQINPNTPISYILEKKRWNLITIVQLIRSIGTPDITKYSQRLYGFPSPELVKDAEQALTLHRNKIKRVFDEKLDTKNLTITQVKRQVETYLQKNNIQWTCVICSKGEISGRWKTENSTRRVLLNKAFEPFSQRDVLKLIEHEVQVHAKRSDFGRRSPLQILGFGTSGYLPTEEGFTSHFEKLKNLDSFRSEGKKILYVLGINKAQNSSFYEVFEYFTKNLISANLAFEVTVKIKRGLCNTAQHGGFFKDHVYFVGDRLLTKFIAAGGNAQDLLGGKLGVNDAKYLMKKWDIQLKEESRNGQALSLN